MRRRRSERELLLEPRQLVLGEGRQLGSAWLALAVAVAVEQGVEMRGSKQRIEAVHARRFSSRKRRSKLRQSSPPGESYTRAP